MWYTLHAKSSLKKHKCPLPKPRKKYPCEKCDRSYTYNKVLTQRMRKDHGMADFQNKDIKI